MRYTCCNLEAPEMVEAAMATMVTWMMGVALTLTLALDLNLITGTMTFMSHTSFSQHLPEQEICCNGVLGYASDNLSTNYPCQSYPCCNNSDTVSVIAIDFAMGFRFQCLPRRSIQPLCYETGAEVRTTNQDPDFIPRACCQGLKFKVLVNQWYAAMVIKCVAGREEDAGS